MGMREQTRESPWHEGGGGHAHQTTFTQLYAGTSSSNIIPNSSTMAGSNMSSCSGSLPSAMLPIYQKKKAEAGGRTGSMFALVRSLQALRYVCLHAGQGFPAVSDE